MRRGRRRTRDIWAVRDVSFSVAARRVRRARRPERIRKDDAAAPDRGDLRAQRGPSRGGRLGRLAARARRRLPPGLHRPRERLPERVDPRPLAALRSRADGRDRRLLRARAVHRLPGPDVLARGCTCGSASQWRRIFARTSCCSTRCSRSATRRSSASASARSSSSRAAAGRSSSSRTRRRRRREASASARCSYATAGSSSTDRRTTSIARYQALLAEDEDPDERGAGLQEWGSGEAASSRCASRTPRGSRGRSTWPASRSSSCSMSAVEPGVRRRRSALELHAHGGALDRRRDAGRSTSSAGTRAMRGCGSRSSRCRSSTAASTSPLAGRRRRARHATTARLRRGDFVVVSPNNGRPRRRAARRPLGAGRRREQRWRR